MGYVGNACEDVDGEKDNSLKTSYLSLTGQPSTKQATSANRPSGYEGNIHSWEFNFNQECVNPKSIIKRNDRPLSTDSSIYVIPMVRSTRRKFIVCKQNLYENVFCGKQYYENVFSFTDMKCGSNSGKFEINKGENTVHGECLDDDEYVEVGNPYQNIEKRQKNALLKSSSNEEMEPSMETAKTQLKDDDQQHKVYRRVRLLYLILLY